MRTAVIIWVAPGWNFCIRVPLLANNCQNVICQEVLDLFVTRTSFALFFPLFLIARMDLEMKLSEIIMINVGIKHIIFWKVWAVKLANEPFLYKVFSNEISIAFLSSDWECLVFIRKEELNFYVRIVIVVVSSIYNLNSEFKVTTGDIKLLLFRVVPRSNVMLRGILSVAENILDIHIKVHD